jgi:hypothetical protein
MKRLAVLCAAFALVCPAAEAATARPAMRVTYSARPNANGWFRAPATATIAVTGVKRIDSCKWGVGFEDARTGLGSSRYARSFNAAACAVTGSVTRSGTASVTLSATAGKWSQKTVVPLRLDDGAPAIAIGSPSLPVVVSPVTIAGTVADSYSGPDGVRLHFSDVLGVQPSFDATATCDGCGTFHDCNQSCGFATTWQVSRTVAPGVWTVSAAATDLAGNTTITDPLTLVVV